MSSGKYSASTPSSSDPTYSHMNQYSSQAGSNEPGALSKDLQFRGLGCFSAQPEYLRHPGIFPLYTGTSENLSSRKIAFLHFCLSLPYVK